MHKTVVIIGFIQAFFGVLIFVSKRPKHSSFVFLTIWMAVIAVFLGSLLLPFQVIDYFKPGIFPVLFLFGPLLYLYVSSLSVDNFRLNPILLVHLLPMIAISLHRSIVNPVSINIDMPNANISMVYNNIYYGLLILSMFVYWVFSLKLIIKHRESIPDNFSNYSSKNSLSWLVSVITLFLVLFIIDFFMMFMNRVGIEVGRFSILSHNLTIFTFIMIFFGINQSVIYKTRRILKEEPYNSENQEVRYSRSSLNEKQIEELTNTVFQYLKNKKPYLNPDYSLQMMAEDLNISRHKLSEAINNGQKKNFYKLINEFRVEEVKEMLANSAYCHYSVLGIGLECGFNSKTSFNRIFKEETGFTPSEYKKTV
jgi:AraC-like DNA-binding protein